MVYSGKRRHQTRIVAIIDERGRVQTQEHALNEDFLQYFEKLLGTSFPKHGSVRAEVIDMGNTLTF